MCFAIVALLARFGVEKALYTSSVARGAEEAIAPLLAQRKKEKVGKTRFQPTYTVVYSDRSL